MRKLIQEAKYDIICDTCGTALENQILIDRITLILGDTEYNFCSYPCMVQFLINELKKEKNND